MCTKVKILTKVIETYSCRENGQVISHDLETPITDPKIIACSLYKSNMITSLNHYPQKTR